MMRQALRTCQAAATVAPKQQMEQQMQQVQQVQQMEQQMEQFKQDVLAEYDGGWHDVEEANFYGRWNAGKRHGKGMRHGRTEVRTTASGSTTSNMERGSLRWRTDGHTTAGGAITR